MRLEESVAAYREQLRDGKNELANTAGLAEALLATGEYREALLLFERAGAAEKAAAPGTMGRDIQVSVCEWLRGERARAAAIMRTLVSGTRDGSITYARDLAGGVTQGLLLRYMSSAAGLEADFDLSVAYLGTRAQAKTAHNWPGPVARFAVGAATVEQMLNSGIGVATLSEAKQVAARDLLKRRWLTNILFNVTVNFRIAGDATGCRNSMLECVGRANPMIEYEWYLAKKAVDSLS